MIIRLMDNIAQQTDCFVSGIGNTRSSLYLSFKDLMEVLKNLFSKYPRFRFVPIV
ncbi:MAG: hypothetical protein RMJ37_02025 [Spirochaetia bacterium]|nr:hypothetical protein [Spirochaetota bacterium]MCX8097129.1 hypothetical protein [Spirochaetota bacterium]MDW8112102.1 hypothetical protein [Spirochaetia bacterium]